MSLNERIEILLKQHKQLDKEIDLCYSNYIADPLLDKMKKQKLAIKDEIERLTRTVKNET